MHRRQWHDKRQHNNHPYDRSRRRTMRQSNQTRGVQPEAAPGGVATRGGGGARQSNNQPSERGAAKGGGVINGGGQGAVRRRNKRERLRCWEMRQPTEREGYNERRRCDGRGTGRGEGGGEGANGQPQAAE
jgi:hypothetical protein